MEFIIILAIVFLANPRWLGKHLAATHKWYLHFFNMPKADPVHIEEVRRRAKNIRRIRNERFRLMRDDHFTTM